MDFYAMLPNLIEAGIIVIDSQGYIKVYNESAREYFGLNPSAGPGHPGGKLKDGDIIVIVDNMLGDDDGGLTPADLQMMGVNPGKISSGDAVIAVGKKGDWGLTGRIKSLPRDHQETNLTMDTTQDGVTIQAHVDFKDRIMSIKIDGVAYNYRYFSAVGHMVAIDGSSHQVKFYQHRGFTSRKEGIRELLQGSSYEGKGQYLAIMDPLDKHILQLHPDSEVVNRLLNTASGREGNVIGIESFINRIPVRCSIKALDVGTERIGALLEILDISELKAIQSERERALIDLKSLEERINKEKLQNQAFRDIVGQSPAMQGLVKTAIRLAETNSTVLLQGESGTGKNLIAEAIHKASPRRNGPFVYINCASIPENLLESELFGHKKGSFTGAISDKLGKFKQADKGTIFLDEINELPQMLQAKILHVIQNRTYTMVGGLEPISVDIRIIAASNKDLADLVTQGLFRNDLYYRINVLSIYIPPLRKHKEDLIQLIGYLTERLEKKTGRSKKEISSEVIKIFFNYDWPGNVRELENVLERAMIMSDDMIYPEHLPQHILEDSHAEQGERDYVFVKRIGPMKDVIEDLERKVLVRALELTGGNKKKAIDVLEMGKTGFYEKLKKFGLRE